MAVSFAMSDIFWQSIIAGAVAIAIAWIKRDTDRKIAAIQKSVDGQTLAQHRSNADFARYKATQTGSPEHAEAAHAAEAELLYQENKARNGAK